MHRLSLLPFVCIVTLAASFAAAQDTRLSAPDSPAEQAANADTFAPIRALTPDDVRKGRMLDSFGWSNGLVRTSPETTKNDFWIAPENASQDGTLRSAFRIGKYPDFSLLFRADFPKEDIAQVNGYSLSVHHNRAQFHRWEQGYAEPVTEAVKFDKMPTDLALSIDMYGPHFEAVLRDGRTGNILISMKGDDASFRGTEYGLRIHKKQDKVTAMTALEFVPGKKYSGRWPDINDPETYVRQHPSVYVAPPAGTKSENLSRCKKISNDGIKALDVYRCSHEEMMQLTDDRRRLPKGWRWAEPRNSFYDSEYRKAALDLDCPKPMQCTPNGPLDPNKSAKDAEMIQAYIDAYAEVCKKHVKYVRTETIGTSWMGHPIRAIVLSNAPQTQPIPRMLINASHHGIELLAADFAFDVLESICEPKDEASAVMMKQAIQKTELWVIPTVNLDGVDMFFHVSDHLGRKNGRGVFKTLTNQDPWPNKSGSMQKFYGYSRYRPNDIRVGAGVDINRNYPLMFAATGELSSSSRPRDYWYRGEFAGSEPEIQSMMNLFHTEQFASSISFHTVSNRILVPYSIDALQNPPHDQDYLWKIGERMAEAAGPQATGKPYGVVKNLYSVDGTDQDWFRMISGSAAYLIEGALHNPTGAKRRSAVDKNRPAWQSLLSSTADATIIRAVDALGNPLIAEVVYSDMPPLNNEHWMTRCHDGSHVMVCDPQAQNRSVTVMLMDGQTQTKQIACPSQSPTEFIFDRPDDYTLEKAACASGQCESLYGVDMVCSLRNQQCPTLPALQWCLVNDVCIPAGSLDFGIFSAYFDEVICDPRENNRNLIRRVLDAPNHALNTAE